MAKKRHPDPMIKQSTRPKIGLIMSNPGGRNWCSRSKGSGRLGFWHHVIGGQVAEGHEKDQKRAHDLRWARSWDVKPPTTHANHQTEQQSNGSCNHRVFLKRQSNRSRIPRAPVIPLTAHVGASGDGGDCNPKYGCDLPRSGHTPGLHSRQNAPRATNPA